MENPESFDDRQYADYEMHRDEYCPNCKEYKECNLEYKEDSGYCDNYKEA